MTKELEIPLAAFVQVADLIVENGLQHEITATDEDDELITITFTYSRDEREAIHEIEDLVEDAIEDEESDDDDE